MTPAAGRRMAVLVVLVVLVALLPACSHSTRAEGPTATLGTAPPAPTTTSTTNPYAVPSVIDAAYVNRVLAGLDGVMRDVTRMVIQTKTIPRSAYDRLRAVYDSGDWLQLQLNHYQDDIRANFVDYKADPGNMRSSVTQLLLATPTCIFAKVVRDYSAVGRNSATADPQWIALKPLDPVKDPGHRNPTPWAFVYDGYPPERTQPQNPCAG